MMKDSDVGFQLSVIDRFLLGMLVASIFFEPYLPYLSGSSTPFWIFVIASFYTALTRIQTFEKVISSYYFLAVIGFALICAMMESLHPDSDYSVVTRFISMSSGMFCISVLCRNTKTIDVIIYTFIFCSALNAIIIIEGTFNFLTSYSAAGFDEASRARITAFEDLTVKDYVDDVSILSSIGAILGMVMFFYEKVKWKKVMLFILLVLSTIGTLLPASRTGALVLLVGMGIFLLKSKVSWKRLVIPAVGVSIFMYFFIPQVVWERIVSTLNFTEIREVDSRARLYTAMFRHFKDYFFDGVGMGNYWKSWAVASGITNISSYHEAKPIHSAFFQVWIYWGLPGIISFLLMLYIFSRALKRNSLDNRQITGIYIFIVVIPVILLFYPMIYHKAFAVGTGLMLATKFWNITGETKGSEALADDPAFNPNA